MPLLLRRSEKDPDWVEVVDQDRVVHEVEVLFPLRHLPSRFSSLEDALAWLQQMEGKLAQTKAYRLLAARSYSTALLIAKLRHHRYSEAVVSKVVGELEALGFIQNERYATRLVEEEFRRGYGPRWIEQKLKQKGLSPHFARAHITDAMQREKMGELSKKWGALPRIKAMRKWIARGFDLDQLPR